MIIRNKTILRWAFGPDTKLVAADLMVGATLLFWLRILGHMLAFRSFEEAERRARTKLK